MTIRRIEKPWGEEILFAHTRNYAGKVLNIRNGELLSLQYHERKDETIYFQTGSIRLTLDREGQLETRTLLPGEACHIPPPTRHRMEAIEDTTLFEVSTPELEDVVRLQDRYGRV